MSASDTGIMFRCATESTRKRRPETSFKIKSSLFELPPHTATNGGMQHFAFTPNRRWPFGVKAKRCLSPLRHRSQGFSSLWPSLSHACTLSLVVIISNKTRTNYPATPAICDFYRLNTNSM
ncbi:hypothetical protein ATANTOWER_025073 [Ataeniobius toweri]|uniref:Uncharacterized protein n=1 Tax=Ataeniobius toweri TaxID=208326 RepID=A0ABU7A9F7_9TELE|nr:hypothetical protein [Ataeniobius toweri]